MFVRKSVHTLFAIIVFFSAIHPNHRLPIPPSSLLNLHLLPLFPPPFRSSFFPTSRCFREIFPYCFLNLSLILITLSITLPPSLLNLPPYLLRPFLRQSFCPTLSRPISFVPLIACLDGIISPCGVGLEVITSLTEPRNKPVFGLSYNSLSDNNDGPIAGRTMTDNNGRRGCLITDLVPRDSSRLIGFYT